MLDTPLMFHNMGEADDYVFFFLVFCSAVLSLPRNFSIHLPCLPYQAKLSDSHNPFNISTLADYRSEIHCYF